MARKKTEAAAPAAAGPKRPEALEALTALFDAIPRGKLVGVMWAAERVEIAVRSGLIAASLLKGIRQYFIDTPTAGGDGCPFVQEIDKLIPRD